MDEGYALVVPKPGKEKETIRLLLDLAEKARHVKTNTDGSGIAFVVPEYLHKKYIQSGETEITGQRRRGRPPGSGRKPAPVPFGEAASESED